MYHQRHCHGLFALSNCRCCFACIVAVAGAVTVVLLLLLLFMALYYEFEICVLMNCIMTHINTLARSSLSGGSTLVHTCVGATISAYFLLCLCAYIYCFLLLLPHSFAFAWIFFTLSPVIISHLPHISLVACCRCVGCCIVQLQYTHIRLHAVSFCNFFCLTGAFGVSSRFGSFYAASRFLFVCLSFAYTPFSHTHKGREVFVLWYAYTSINMQLPPLCAHTHSNIYICYKFVCDTGCTLVLL